MIKLASEICKTSDNEDLKDLLLTSVEMARIFYLPASDRNERLILRMYNTTYRNLQALKKIVKNPISMTLRELLGQYIHALGVHAADLLRYTPLSSSIAEEEEKEFHYIKEISSNTSNRSLENITRNACVRSQAERKERLKNHSPDKSDISELADLPER